MRLAVTALLSTAALAHAEVQTASFTSKSLARDVSFSVQLPPSYAAGDKKYPVLYVLHGLFEGHAFWQRRGLAPLIDQMWTAGDVPEMIIVAVDGGNSFFVNSGGGAFEDLVTKDIIAHTEATYRARPGRDARALLGISMGGYAALRIAFAHPDLFCAVATHSAMLLQKVPTREEGAGRWHMTAFNRVFGDPIDTTAWAAADPLAWADKASPKGVPQLYFDCGSEDRYGLFAGNEQLHQKLVSKKIAHEFALHPGDHGYEYVRSVLPRSLKFIGSAFRGRP